MVLSNLYIVENGVMYDSKSHRSVEHAYKSTKCSYHEREDLVTAVDAEQDSVEAMNLVNRAIKRGDETEEWTREKQRIMKDMIESKARSCPEFHSELLSTEGKLLVEATTHSTYASGLPSMEDTSKCEPDEWPGKNRLGLIMMEVRDSLLDKQTTMTVDNSNLIQLSSAEHIEHGKDEHDAMSNFDDLINEGHGIIAASNDNQPSDTQPTETEHSQVSEPQKGITLVLSDSILNGAQCSQSTSITAESGAGLRSISSLIAKSQADENSPQVDNAVIALGTNDLKDNHSSGATNALYSKAVDTVAREFPSAHIFVSAILPRKDTSGHYKDYNDKVADINKFLWEYAKGSENVTFIGNSNTFKKTPHNYYLSQDRSGIHLSRDGQKKLVQIIEEAVAKAAKETKKRLRSAQETPPSASKDAKVRKCDDKSGEEE